MRFDLSPHTFAFSTTSFAAPLAFSQKLKQKSYLLFIGDEHITMAVLNTPLTTSVCKTASQIMSATIFSIQLFCNHLQRSCILYIRRNDLSRGIEIHSAIYLHIAICQCNADDLSERADFSVWVLVFHAGTLNSFRHIIVDRFRTIQCIWSMYII